jgi:GTP-binding protein HflX
LTPTLREIVRRPRPDPALYLGSGAAERLGAQFQEQEIALVVFDHPISAVQQRNLERLWKIRVSDRTELIIDIFSQRARSSEGKLQVELAQLQHQA